ncbi:hypothetical protein Leryth_020546 [Lithospermum erythrorhizon]|nr:hypothetical protein Leryth_020546 [Lithospermum erythrorhizon]
MAARNKVIILETFKVVPSPGTTTELSTPLTCSDMLWLGMTPIHRLTFYQLPVSRTSFLDTIIPGLKNSLSLALKHFPSPAGNLIIHSDSTRPGIRYMDGDSVPFAVAESSFLDFEYLVGNQPRICSQFYPLVPELPKSIESSGWKMFPLISFQVTLFPGQGFCIGITHNHVLGDGTSMYSFVKAWSMICKSGGNEAAISSELHPIYEREMMKVQTNELDNIFWNDLRNTGFKENDMVATLVQLFREETDRVRTTFVISLEDIQKLKKHVSDRRSLKHLSTFTVVCGYAWSCLIKSSNATMVNTIDEEEQQYFIFMADCRGRTDPVIPPNYFGNCLAQFQMSATNKELSGDEGLVTATKLIGETIHQRLQYKGGVLKGIETFLADLEEVKDMSRLLIIAGSPRQNHYDMDFGWGKPRKVEITSIDAMESVSLSGTRDDGGGIEIGFVLPQKKMDVFVEIFREGLQALTFN